MAVAAKGGKEEVPKMTVAEAFRFLLASKEVRCLALMAMSQGIATNLLEVRAPPPPPRYLPHMSFAPPIPCACLPAASEEEAPTIPMRI